MTTRTTIPVICSNTITAGAATETPLRWDVQEALWENAMLGLKKARRASTKALYAADADTDPAVLADLEREESVQSAKSAIGTWLNQLIDLKEIAAVDAMQALMAITKI